MTYTKRWKFLHESDSKIISAHGTGSWTLNEWKTVKGPVKLCFTGFHCSEGIGQAFGYVQGSVLARVEVKGERDSSNDKSAHRSMRLVKAYRWTKPDSVALAIYAAELVIDIFEAAVPNDSRPRKAIEAAKTYLADPSPENQGAARDAAWAAGDAAWAARDAAGDAAWAARDAAGAAARDAAGDAAGAARDAAGAAGDAARAELMAKIEKWMVARVNELEVI